MGASRKLQGEIDRVLKKVQEGVDVFDSIWDKVSASYEQALMDAHMLIEREMERFKICEKETKTKAFSKEGPGQQPKTDPKEKPSHTRDWLNNTFSYPRSRYLLMEDHHSDESVGKDNVAIGSSESANMTDQHSDEHKSKVDDDTYENFETIDMASPVDICSSIMRWSFPPLEWGTYGHIRAEDYPDLPPDAVPPNDPDLWKRSVGGRRKGYIFGFGTQDPEYAMSGNSGATTSGSSHHDEEWDALGEGLRQEKEVRLKMEEEAK